MEESMEQQNNIQMDGWMDDRIIGQYMDDGWMDEQQNNT